MRGTSVVPVKPGSSRAHMRPAMLSLQESEHTHCHADGQYDDAPQEDLNMPIGAIDPPVDSVSLDPAPDAGSQLFTLALHTIDAQCRQSQEQVTAPGQDNAELQKGVGVHGVCCLL